VKHGFKPAGQALARLYPMGGSLFWKAPLVLALVILPEFVQHIVEIRLGMFESRESFAALANDPTRMAFGYVKIAGLVVTFLASARFWWTREHGGHWANPRQIAWGRLLLGLLLFIGVPSLAELTEGHVDPWLYQTLVWGLSLIMLPMLFLLLAGLFGDRETPVPAMWRRAWPWLLLTVVLAVLAFAPAQWLHQKNHLWAFGADPVIVWVLMIFDSLLVGLLAGLTGTAFYLGYAAFARGARE
jgi:hypothetical protein